MIAFRLLIALIPFWPLKRLLLCRFYGYKIHPTARIGFSYVYPESLFMASGSVIGHANVCKGLCMLWMGTESRIGRLNWITAYPKGLPTQHFMGHPKRDPRLVVGNHSAITNRHIIDCTDKIVIGPFSTLAGFYSQLLTHSIDIHASRQSCAPIVIGKYSFIGTKTVILPGVRVPSYCVVAAGSVVVKNLIGHFSLYGGVPARFIKRIEPCSRYFLRKIGYVV